MGASASCDRYAGAAGDAGLDTDFGDGPSAFDGDTVLIGPDDFKVNGPWYIFFPPTMNPTANPTANPTKFPTAVPTANPTASPSGQPTANPTADPTTNPTVNPKKMASTSL